MRGTCCKDKHPEFLLEWSCFPFWLWNGFLFCCVSFFSPVLWKQPSFPSEMPCFLMFFLWCTFRISCCFSSICFPYLRKCWHFPSVTFIVPLCSAEEQITHSQDDGLQVFHHHQERSAKCLPCFILWLVFCFMWGGGVFAFSVQM